MCSCDFGMPKIHSRTPTHHAHHNLLVSKIINNSQLKGNGGSNAFKKMAGNLHLLLWGGCNFLPVLGGFVILDQNPYKRSNWVP